MTIAERLKEERLRLGFNQPDFAALGGRTKKTLIDYEKGATSPDADFLSAINDKGADVQYILTGERKLAAQYKKETSDQEVNDKIAKYHRDDYAEIPRYDVRAAAGTGAAIITEEQIKPLAFRVDWLKARHLSPGHLAIVDVHGDSMEPRLHDGDLVLVDRSQTTVASGKTYVLRMDHHLIIKNLQLLPHGLVQVASFNAGFPPYQIDLSDESLDIAVIGRVVASMHEW